MFKKISAALFATAFVFGAVFNMQSVTKKIPHACLAFCSCHDGDGWSN